MRIHVRAAHADEHGARPGFTGIIDHLVNFFLSLRRLLIVVEKPELCK